jgi:hypothetical protein
LRRQLIERKEIPVFKKFTVICGLLLAASAATAGLPWPWMPLDSTPFPVGEGAHITYGNDRIWGMFPTEDSSRTFVYYYSPLPTEEDTNDPNVGEWCSLPRGNSRWFGWTLAYTGMTYQWGKALYVIGADTSDPDEPPDGYLDRYILDRDTWIYYDIDEDTEVVLGEGACIAYAPNLGYSSSNQAEGYIYCLPGDGTEFWRYSIEPDSYIVVAGIFPPNSSVIADQTPLFQWTGGLIQYRLQVAADPSFSPGSCVIDAVVSATEYQTPGKLANDTFYWRTGTPNGLNWTWATARSFTLQGGFVRLWPNIPEGVAKGAAMAYTGFPGNEDYPAIYVLNGYLGANEARYFHRWDVQNEGWQDLDQAPCDAGVGTSLTSPDPVSGIPGWHAVDAAFGSFSSSRPYGYEPVCDPGERWFIYPDSAFDNYPEPVGPGGSFVIGPSVWAYLTPGAPYVNGDPTRSFYAIDPCEVRKYKKHKDRGGSQAGDVIAGNVRAQALASNNGVEVEYQLPAAARVRAALHDAVGRQVGVLDAGSQQPGTHRLSWNQDRGGRKLASGAYFVLLDMGVEKATLKAIIR